LVHLMHGDAHGQANAHQSGPTQAKYCRRTVSVGFLHHSSLPHRTPTGEVIVAATEDLMSREGELNGTSKLEAAKDAVKSIADTVQATTQSVADAIEAGRQPGAPLDRLAEWTREAPLHAVLVAFLVGMMLGRRR
jgi:ElaB/YqjD/DUF883 family membrane-anchored ribosome-binding protein